MDDRCKGEKVKWLLVVRQTSSLMKMKVGAIEGENSGHGFGA